MKKYWAGGFLYNPQTNSVLLHKRDSNTNFNPNSWAFFGGLNEGDEKHIECFLREIHEEIGIKLKSDEVIALCDYFNEEFKTYRFVFYALSDKKKSDFILNEGEDFDWIDLNKVSNYKVTEKTKKDLKFFIENKRYP